MSTIGIPVARALKFRLEEGDWQPGDERVYQVIYRGFTIGFVERTWIPAAHSEETAPFLGWAFESDATDENGRHYTGDGLTRAAAVIDAYTNRTVT